MRTLSAAIVVTCLLSSVARADQYGRYNRGYGGAYQYGVGQIGVYVPNAVPVYVYPPQQWQPTYWQGGYGGYGDNWPQQGPPRAYYRQLNQLNFYRGGNW